MKSLAILMFVFCYVECRKIVPIDKNANLAFINMEGGGGVRPNNVQPTVTTTKKTPSPAHSPTPAPAPVNKQPVTPTPAVVTPKTPETIKSGPVVTPPTTNSVTPKRVNPPVVSNPITTPGPGSVKQLVNFYDSQGRASPIRPYSYSQAVKQG